MASWCYLMSVSGFWEGVTGERLLKAALEKIDKERRKRVGEMKAGKPRAVCVGAGLLLQMAVQMALGAGVRRGVETGLPLEAGGESEAGEVRPLLPDGEAGEGLFPWMGAGSADVPAADEKGAGALVTGEDDTGGLVVYSVLQVMELVGKPIELVMDYGEKGKPYLREHPLFFNLSHSGEYVVCAVSDTELGVDIQMCSDVNAGRIAERFFSIEERKALKGCGTEEERRRLFFRLWTRKEAYGKLLGDGVVGVISENLLPDVGGLAAGRELLWREWDYPEGYRIAMCQRAYQAQ